MQNVELENIFQQIAEEKKSHGSYMQQPPCSEPRIVQLRERAWAEFGVELPAAYLDFLRRMNGLYYNGAVFYAAYNVLDLNDPSVPMPGFMEVNRDFRKIAPHLLFFGDDDIDSFVYNASDRMFCVVDKIGLDRVAESYDDYESLMVAALKDLL